MRDYKKVQIQLENLETSVRDRCKKEFTGPNHLYQNNVSFKIDLKYILSCRSNDRDDGHV